MSNMRDKEKEKYWGDQWKLRHFWTPTVPFLHVANQGNTICPAPVIIRSCYKMTKWALGCCELHSWVRVVPFSLPRSTLLRSLLGGGLDCHSPPSLFTELAGGAAGQRAVVVGSHQRRPQTPPPLAQPASGSATHPWFSEEHTPACSAQDIPRFLCFLAEGYLSVCKICPFSRRNCLNGIWINLNERPFEKRQIFDN